MSTPAPISARLRAPSGTEHVGRRAAHADIRPDVYDVHAIGPGGQRHHLKLQARGHQDLHEQLVRHIGAEPVFSSCRPAPGSQAHRDARAAASLAAACQARPPIKPRPVPQVHMQPDARPSAFGEPTDIDRRCDAIDSELEQQEQRHTPRSRRIALGWLIAAAAASLAVWTAAAVGIGALAARADRWQPGQPPAVQPHRAPAAAGVTA